MVRAPCCEKMGLKKGPWTREEDQILINYISLYGHGNWRALPKLAGLLRCGKSCRLRWTNYLRPDIKRGNFSREEEETIINLHAALGNRWSAIAARLPGRTDNEIKNVWHTHLKKRVNKLDELATIAATRKSLNKNPNSILQNKIEVSEEKEEEKVESPSERNSSSQTSYTTLSSPQHSCSEISSVTSTNTTNDNEIVCIDKDDLCLENFPEMDEDFWTEVFSGGNSGDFAEVYGGCSQLQLPRIYNYDQSGISGDKANMNDEMDFWFNVFTRAEELLPELPQI